MAFLPSDATYHIRSLDRLRLLVKTLHYVLYPLLLLSPSGFAAVNVTSPSNGATVSSPALYVATATTTCAKGVATMGIYVDNVLVHVVNGDSLNYQLTLSSGPEHTVVEEWDHCGGATFETINVTVKAG